MSMTGAGLHLWILPGNCGSAAKECPGFHPRYLFKLWVDFSKIFLHEEGKVKGKRVFFYESFTSGDLLSFILAAACFAKQKDRLWILFRFVRGKKEMALQAFLIKLLRKIRPQQLVVLTDSELLISHLEKQFHTPIQLLSHYFSTITPKKTEMDSDKIVCSWLGGPRMEKGFHAIERLMALPDESSAKFKLILSEKGPSTHTNLLSIQRTKENLSWQEYETEFLKSTVILLPYDPSSYAYRTSGIFIEAVVNGKIPVVRAGTWLAYHLKQFDLDELIMDWEHPLFFTQLFELLQNKEMHQKLKTMQKTFSEFHSEPSFVSRINQLLNIDN